MPGAPLELHEREEIFRALVEDPQAGWAAIGRRVGRHPTTVAREINAGGGRERYGPAAAQRRAEVARRRARRRRLEAPGPLRDRICAELRRGRSPAAIRADLAAEGVEAPPCVETVYQALYSGALDVKPAECLRSRRRRRRCRQQRNPRSRSCGPNIAARPAAVERARRGGPLGGRSDHRRLQPVLDDLVDRTPKPLPDTGHHARRLRRRRRPRRPHRGPRRRPRAPAPQPDLRLRVRMGELAPPRRPTTTYRCGSATRTRRGNAARSRTRTAKCAGGSHGAPTSASSPPPKPNTPQTSSTTSAAAASTTKAQQNSMLPSPCSDRWNWPTHLMTYKLSRSYQYASATRLPQRRGVRQHHLDPHRPQGCRTNYNNYRLQQSLCRLSPTAYPEH